MPSWRCSTAILRRPSSACASGGGQIQSHFGTIAARSTRRFGTTFPTGVMVIALRFAAISRFDNIGNRPQAPEGQLLASSFWLLVKSKSKSKCKSKISPQRTQRNGEVGRQEAGDRSQKALGNRLQATAPEEQLLASSFWLLVKSKSKSKCKGKTSPQRTQRTICIS